MTKKEILALSDELQACYKSGDITHFYQILDQSLSSKIKFPKLEDLAVILHEFLSEKEEETIIQQVIKMDHIGSYPFCGKLIQLRLEKNIKHAFKLAAWSIHEGNVWYACDTISERVYGFALLKDFKNAFPLVKELSESENYWDRRGVGVATHLAVKWGLPQKESLQLLDLALKHKAATNHEEKTGIGWGMKTITKFFPEMVRERKILESENLPPWMATKVKKGFALAELKKMKSRQS
ncbi:MAG: DNA alkylation repair protein [Saprospiraceae bacterium]